MNFKLSRYISKAFFQSENNNRFIRFIRIVSIAGVALGSIAILVPLAVLDGFHYELRKKAVEFSSHITLSSYNKKPIENSDLYIRIIKEKVQNIKNIQPIIQQAAILKNKEKVDGVLIRSIKSKSGMLTYSQYITKGNITFNSDYSNDIIISESLSDKLKAKINQKLVLYSLSDTELKKGAFPSIEIFKISGIYSSGMGKFDENLCFIPYGTASNFFNIPFSSCTDIELNLNNIEEAPKISKLIQSHLGYPIYTFTVFDSFASIFNWIDLQREPIPIVLGLIGVVAVFNIISSLLVLVLDKTNTIGIIKTLGLNSKQVRLIFILQGLKIAIKGLAIGCSLTLIATVLQKYFGFITLNSEIYYLDKVPIAINIYHYLIVISVTLFFSTLASAIPAFAASRVSPIKAIRFK